MPAMSYVWDELETSAGDVAASAKGRGRDRGAAGGALPSPPPAPTPGGGGRRRFIWDEMDSAPSGSREDEAKAPWHEAAFEQAADPSSTFEAIQRKVAEMMEELADKRAAVRERQLELKRLRADASAEVSRRAAAYERKAKESAKSHGAAVERQTVLLAKMRGDVTHLRGRAAELQKQSSSAAAVRASRLERLTDELDDSARLAREQWSATETKDLSRVVEKRRDAVKAKVIKALEPEVHRLISANRDDAQKRRESDARWLSQQRCDLEAAHEADLALERRKVEDDLEEDLAGLRRRNSDKLRQLHQRAERDVAELWEAQKRSLEAERDRYEAERQRDDDRARRDADALQAWERGKAAEHAAAHKRAEIDAAAHIGMDEDVRQANFLAQRNSATASAKTALAAQRPMRIDALLRPVRQKCDDDLRMVTSRLRAQAEAELRDLAAALEAERKECASLPSCRVRMSRPHFRRRRLDGATRLVASQSDAIDDMKAREASAMEAHLGAAAARTALQARIRALDSEAAEASAAAARHRDESVDARDRASHFCASAAEKRDALADELAAELQAARARVAAAVAAFDSSAGAAAQAAVEAEAAQRLQRQVHADELEGIEGKIRATLDRKATARDALLAKLAQLQQASAAKEAEIGERRERNTLLTDSIG
ncbi:hypothetical protein M885DRAFT_106459 [Pelagophyceae sp. CCMP2097]|nr:hypothetical protein M885DRAFT_106459 [Pelagophyceae sp. CCMP2097]